MSNFIGERRSPSVERYVSKSIGKKRSSTEWHVCNLRGDAVVTSLPTFRLKVATSSVFL